MSFETIVFPSDYFSLGNPDPHFAEEAMLAKQMGFDVVYYNHDKIQALDSTKAICTHLSEGKALWRGWMLQPDQYEFLHKTLLQKGIELLDSPDQYKKSHHFDGWYTQFANFVAPAVWTQGPNFESLVQACKALPAGSGMLKDYVKSLSHIPQASFVEDVHKKESVLSTAQAFYKNIATEIQGGFVVRSWRDYKPLEWRTWWIDGEFRLCTAHPNTPGQTPDSLPPVEEVKDAVKNLNVGFVTLDWAQLVSGKWNIIEVGNGAVSDRPTSTEAQVFLEALK